MNPLDDDEREKEALDALIVGGLRGRPADKVTFDDLKEIEGCLSDADHKALDALGTDLGSRIVAGERAVVPQREEELQPHEELASAINRGNLKDELTDKAAEEIERRIDGDEDEEQEPSTDG